MELFTILKNAQIFLEDDFLKTHRNGPEKCGLSAKDGP